MPQPFPRHLKNPQFQVGDGASQRPALYFMGMAAIAAYSKVEASLGTAMIHLLGADPEPALVMLTAIKNHNIKQMAYAELASEQLGDLDLPLFTGVMKKCAAAEKERNRLAHDLWATELQLPKAVILISSREFSKIRARGHVLRASPNMGIESTKELIAAIRKSGLVYTKADFVQILDQMNDTFFLVTALTIILDRATPDHEVAKQRQQLQAALQ